MSETIRKGVAAPSCVTTRGNGTATKVSYPNNKNSSGTFVRVGSIILDQGILRISYEAFGEKHTAVLTEDALRVVTIPGAPIVDITRTYPDDKTVAIGKAWRSQSGRALILRTIDSEGEVLVPWRQFLSVIAGDRTKGIISRFVEVPA